MQLVLAGVVLIATYQYTLAQQPIGAGGQIQQIPSAPAVQNPIPQFPANRREAPIAQAPSGPKFLVKSLHVTGDRRFSESELIAVSGFRPDSELGLADLRAIAAKMSDFYNKNGYFVAQAYLPAQEVKNGTVTIAIIEGHYGGITLNNQAHVSDHAIQGVLDGLNVGDPVVSEPLERRLLIISDIPGVEVKSTLSPGSAVGTSDLAVGVTPGPRVFGSVEFDNAGNPYTGQYRLGGDLTVAEPLGIGDEFGVRFLASTTGGMDYGRVFYQTQVQDATVGVAYTAFEYRLGRQFTSLDATGSEEIASVYGSYPLIRSYNDNLNALADLDYRTFRDTLGATSTTTDKHAWVIVTGFSGDSHDQFGGGGSNAYSVIGSFGVLDIESAAAREEDAMTARTNGGYAKLAFSASRLQHLIGPFSLFGWVRGQVAPQNLDISEKMELGGADGVRAYPEGESYGDDGYIGTLEARWQLPKVERLPGDLQLIAFVDTGSIIVDESPWYKGNNTQTRSGAGVGLTWADINNFSISVTYAHELGQNATSAPDRFGGFWVQLIKYF